MCMINDDTWWKVSRCDKRKARKTHRCGECRRNINPGETYEYFTGINSDGYGWETYRTCAHCQQAARWLRVFCGGSVFEMSADDLAEHVNDGEESYMHTDQLAELVRWQESDWLDASGALRALVDVEALVDAAIAATHELSGVSS